MTIFFACSAPAMLEMLNAAMLTLQDQALGMTTFDQAVTRRLSV